MEDIVLTTRQAYDAMYHFLVEYYRQTNNDGIGGCLGDIQINRYDDKPMDPAMWSDWLDAVRKVVNPDKH